VAIIWAATNGYLDKLPIEKVAEFEEKYLENLSLNHKALLEKIEKEKVVAPDQEKTLEKVAKSILEDYYEPTTGEEKN